jgi:hypothetical protein
MSSFAIQPVARARAPRFPLSAEFRPELLERAPFRSRASRPLAMAMAAMGVGGVGAQGLNLGSSQSGSFMLDGRPAYPIGPTVMELIDPVAAEALIARVFAEHGYDLSQQDVEVAEGFEVERWDSERRLGVMMPGPEDFSSELAWAYYLQRTLGDSVHITNDPRGCIDNWLQSVSEKERMEVEGILHRTSNRHSFT